MLVSVLVAADNADTGANGGRGRAIDSPGGGDGCWVLSLQVARGGGWEVRPNVWRGRVGQFLVAFIFFFRFLFFSSLKSCVQERRGAKIRILLC